MDKEQAELISAMVDNDIHLAKSGDRKAALGLLNTIRTKLYAHATLDWRHADYLANCLSLILDSDISADVALNIKKPKHRPRKGASERDQQIAAEIGMLTAIGATQEEAITAIHDGWKDRHVSRSVIEDALKNNRDITAYFKEYMQSRGRTSGE
jgi:hypothetical protein